MVAQRLIDHRTRRVGSPSIVGGVVTVVTAVISIVQVIRIGHAGSIAVWGG